MMLLISCSTKSLIQPGVNATVDVAASPTGITQLENALAKKLLHLAYIEINNADEADRAQTIEFQLRKIEHAIDQTHLSRQNQLQIRVLDSLLNATRTNNTTAESKINEILKNSSLELDGKATLLLARSRLKMLHEKTRLLTGTDEDTALLSLFDSIRSDDKNYQSNTENGRQKYLTLIVDKLVEIESLAPLLIDLPIHAELNLMGFDNENSTNGSIFNYDQINATLEVDLTDMRHLPSFELESIAHFYGVPGLHTLASAHDRFEIQSLQRLRDYDNGWAAYINTNLDRIPLYQHPIKVLERTYFELFFVSMAIVDYSINIQNQNNSEAIKFLTENSPYPPFRIERSLALAHQYPGQYFGQFVGLLEFEALRQQAEKSLQGNFDMIDFHNHIVELGPLQFVELRGQMERWIDSKL
jgi:uncharacterized protein (DUF885 family)